MTNHYSINEEYEKGYTEGMKDKLKEVLNFIDDDIDFFRAGLVEFRKNNIDAQWAGSIYNYQLRLDVLIKLRKKLK